MQRGVVGLAATILSAVLLISLYPRWNLTFFAPITLAPLLYGLTQESSAKKRFLLGWLLLWPGRQALPSDFSTSRSCWFSAELEIDPSGAARYRCFSAINRLRSGSAEAAPAASSAPTCIPENGSSEGICE